ncbi:MAG TPA: hypothetical protein VGX92_18680 [Pyrinomonadaceae bacterium]|jgi:hypothetical protein|nr:hypothetical protein [Pyrinomonadaceae bacterium]
MRETLKVINRMVKDGVIGEYAIGGAVAAIYYLEPFDTADLDVFVQVNATANDLTILAPIYEYLTEQGYGAKGELIYIDGIPVQFLPVFNQLTEEAVEKSQTIKYSQVTTRIMRPEYLVAIMLDTGRPKDYLRISMFLEQGAIKMRQLHAVLKRHGLMEKWKDNEYRFKP